jgi:hypothetical protein
MKKYYSIGLTILFFTILTSVISPTVAIEGNAQVKEVEEDFSTSPTPKVAATPAVKGLTKQSPQTSSTPAARNTANQKMIVYKGEVSATPSAVGKFLITTADGQKNIDTDKSTKVFIFDKGTKIVSLVSKIKIGDNAIAIGSIVEDGKALLAKYVVINKNPPLDNPRNAKYGLVSSREASGTAAFVLQIKSPSKDEKVASYTVNAETVVKVKDNDSSKLSDIKIGDRVTFTFYVDEKTKQNIITRIFVIPGRAAGLLKDIRDASAAAEKQSRDEENLKSTAKPSTSPKVSPR